MPITIDRNTDARVTEREARETVKEQWTDQPLEWREEFPGVRTLLEREAAARASAGPGRPRPAETEGLSATVPDTREQCFLARMGEGLRRWLTLFESPMGTERRLAGRASLDLLSLSTGFPLPLNGLEQPQRCCRDDVPQ